ncbi:OmpA family protein [Azonexus sp.]|uniref:OmpA family protein n=1 Tax=Azonexus sp. TaxID=1872668 RepID=UPI0039E258DC
MTKGGERSAGGAVIIGTFVLFAPIMRSLLVFSLAVLLSACATQDDPSRIRQIAQEGALRVHPGLLGQPVPAELQTAAAAPVPAPAETSSMRMDEQGLRAQRSVYFDLNRAEIKADYASVLAAHGQYLARHPQSRVRVEGHADERGSPAYNQRLGLQRAQNVRATLLGHGVQAAQISVKSWGKAKPKLLGRNEEAWAENRRADIVYEKED